MDRKNGLMSDMEVRRIGADLETRKARHLLPLAVFALAGIGIGTALAPDFTTVGAASEEEKPEIRMAQTVAVVTPEDERSFEAPATATASTPTKRARVVRVRAPVSTGEAPDLKQTAKRINPLLRQDVAAVRLANAWVESEIDTARTGSIDRNAEDIAIADTEEKLVAMEEPVEEDGVTEVILSSLSSEHAATMPEPAKKPEKVVEKAPQADDHGLVAGRTTKAVNLRSAPANGSRVMQVVPANAAIKTDASCRHWCEVVYDGSKGYIYKSFIRKTS
ncbi:SH3 domain-containing protein [Hoeflea sp. WL0058]|uniref:SH3 domain-containing protein n=1 Tax=Flavimaribacter sediminis TaxID=2865987 RepID=A0AAE2ZMD7_9HYPH|nr:SH3 domain-containing protein [Flavimaribacter sediminis]MBW8639273.1 SH3 domain-containing protein [Flavimaribacter sediminis]